MVKNKTGGKKHKKYKKNRIDDVQKKLILKDSEQEYALLLERKGGPVMSVKLLDDRKVLGIIRGKLRKRLWMMPGDILLVSKRTFQTDKVDIIDKYSQDDVKRLIKKKEITAQFTNNINNDDGYEDILFDNELSEKDIASPKSQLEWDAI